MELASVGIDIGKTTFHLVGLDPHGKVVLRKKFSRKQLLAYTAKLQGALIGIEACSGAHFIGATLRGQGHDVRLIPAQFVKPFLKSNKNDFLDAEAIAEAVARKNMRFVPIKTDDQLDLQALHRVRDRLVQRRTAVINQIRGFLLERGIVFATGPAKLRREIPSLLEDAGQNLTPRMRSLLVCLWQEWKQLIADVEHVSAEIDAIAEHDAACQRLRQIPGVGPLVSTATVAAIGNGAAFRKGREFAAWLGLIPRQHSTGGKARLLGISKRGNVYLRRLFIHGARAVLLIVKYDTGRLGQWARELALRAPRNKVIVAVANKLARIAWAVLSRETNTELQPQRKNVSSSLLRRGTDERTVKRRAGESDYANGRYDRSAYKDRHARIIIVALEKKLLLRGRIHLRRLNFVQRIPLAGARRTIHSRRCAPFVRRPLRKCRLAPTSACKVGRAGS